MAVKAGVIAIALGLAGCGGGGGGGGEAVAPPVGAGPTAQRVVQGTAAKGLIKGAKVSVYAIDVEGVRATAALASTTTDGAGTYKLQIPATQHDFVIEVSAAPGATMADEATGNDIPLPEGMKLRSVVTLAENATGSYEGSVTPLTEMVARTAEAADGKLRRQAVAQAKASVRILLGFDPETVKPVNSNSAAAATANEDEKSQSLVLAAISKMASSATADCAQGNPGERISCVVGNFAGSVTIKDGKPGFEQNRLAQFRDAIQAVAQDKNANRTGKDKIVGMPILTPGAPALPPVGSTKTPVEATKDLFGSLRTNLQALDKGDAFRSTADGIKADLRDKVMPLGSEAARFGTLAIDAIDTLERYRAGQTTREAYEVYGGHVYDQYYPQPYTVFSPGTGVCRINKVTTGIRCVMHVTVSWNEMADSWYTLPYLERVLRVEPKPGSAGEYTYTTYVQRNELSYSSNATPLPPRAVSGVFTGNVTFTRSNGEATQLSVQGRMPGRLDSHAVFASDYEDWSLNVNRTAETGGTYLYKFAGVFTAFAGATSNQPERTLGKVEIDDTSFVRLAMQDGDANIPVNAANELKVTLRGIVGGTTVSGTLHASDDKYDKSKKTHMPTKLSFEGSLKHGDAEVFSGSVAINRKGYENFDASAPESDTNFVADTVEIGGTLSVPERPTLSLTLGATRTGKDSADVSAQYGDGSSVINASVSVKVGERHPLVKVASADGVAFSFTDTATPVAVTKDGAVVAQLDLTRGIITYRDGTTESLK